MKKDLLKLKQLRDHLVGLEMNLSMIERDLQAVEKDIAFLNNLQTVLVENLTILKSDKIIAIASEYKRSDEELKKVRENLSFYSNMKIKLQKDFDKYEKARVKYFEEYTALQQVINRRKVILLFDPSKRKKPKT